MSFSLYDWIGPLEPCTTYYHANRKGKGERAETLLYIARDVAKAEIWIVTVEEAEALINELHEIRKFLALQPEKAA